MGVFEFVGKVLQKLLSKLFVGAKQVYFLFFFASPGFHVLSYFINAFLGQYILIIGFFPPCRLGLVNEFIDEFYFTEDKSLQHKRNQEVAAEKDQAKTNQGDDPVFFNIP